MTPNELKRRFPNASQSFINANRDSGIRPDDTKPPQGKPLVSVVQRKAKVSHRFKIRFTVYAMRPADWDGYDIKSLQDLVVQSGIIPMDDWSTLKGEIDPKKVHKEAEEKTVIEIFRL